MCQRRISSNPLFLCLIVITPTHLFQHSKLMSDVASKDREIESLKSRLTLSSNELDAAAKLMSAEDSSKNSSDSAAENAKKLALIAEHRIALANVTQEKTAEIMRLTAEHEKQVSTLDLKVSNLIAKGSEDLARQREERERLVAALERNNESLKRSLEQSTQKQESVERNNESIKRSLEQSTQKQESGERNLRAAKAELDLLKAQAEERKLASERDASSTAEERDVVIGELRGEVAQLNGILLSERQKLDEALEVHSSAVSKHKDELMEGQEKYHHLRSERDALEAKAQDFDLQKSNAAAEKENVERKLKQANEHLNLLELEKTNALKERDLEESNLKREIHAGAESVRALESEQHSKIDQLRQADIEAQDAQSTVKMLKEQLRCVETDTSLRISELERSDRASSRKVVELERDVLSLRGQCDGLINKQLALGEELTASETTNIELRSELRSKLAEKQMASELSASESESKFAALQKELDKVNVLRAASEKREKSLKADAEVITGEMLEMQKLIDILPQKLGEKAGVLADLEAANNDKKKMKEWQGIRDAQTDEEMIAAKRKILELEHRVRLKEGEVNGLKIELRRRGGGVGAAVSSGALGANSPARANNSPGRASQQTYTESATPSRFAGGGGSDDSDDDGSTPQQYGSATDTPLEKRYDTALRLSQLGSSTPTSSRQHWVPAMAIPARPGDRALSPARRSVSPTRASRLPTQAESDIAKSIRREIGALNASRNNANGGR